MGQMWYLIVLIPDRCLLSYLGANEFEACKLHNFVIGDALKMYNNAKID